MLFKSAMSLFWPRRLLARLGFDVVVVDNDDNSRHRQFDWFQFCSICALASLILLFYSSWFVRAFFFLYLFICRCYCCCCCSVFPLFRIANSNCNPKTSSFICSVCEFFSLVLSILFFFRCFVVVVVFTFGRCVFTFFFFIRFLSLTSSISILANDKEPSVTQEILQFWVWTWLKF